MEEEKLQLNYRYNHLDMPYLRDFPIGSLAGKKVLVRADLDLPLDYSFEISDYTKIHAALPTIMNLMKHGASVILASHFGNAHYFNLKYSMHRLVPKLSELLCSKVKMANVDEQVEELVNGLQGGEVLLLENLRFLEGELYNDNGFACRLASLADLFVCDSFATLHKRQASTCKVYRFLKHRAVVGFLLRKELECLDLVLRCPTTPLGRKNSAHLRHRVAAIVGGSILSVKADLIRSLLKNTKVDLLLLGGALIYSFYMAKNKSVGSSFVEEHRGVEIARSIMEMAEKNGVELLLPQDVVVADVLGPEAECKVVKSDEIPYDWMGLDIGTDAVSSFCRALDTAGTIIWTGPMGVFEYGNFANGTKAIAHKLARLSELNAAKTIIFGRETSEAVRKMGLKNKMTHISTGPLSSSLYLRREELPGLSSLYFSGPSWQLVEPSWATT